jgi:hypothetical protein
MDSDDEAYRRNVRNMSAILAAVVITIFVALALSPYVFPAPNTFQQSTTAGSPFGFTLHLRINTTSVPAGGEVLIEGWLNSSSSSIDNITAADAWGVGPDGLWTRNCTQGWPIGLGIMRGHYTGDNLTFGTLYPLHLSATGCPAWAPSPAFFLLGPHTSKALVDLNGTPLYWVLQSEFTLNAAGLQPGVYTALLADEWGDVVTTNFVVS